MLLLIPEINNEKYSRYEVVTSYLIRRKLHKQTIIELDDFAIAISHFGIKQSQAELGFIKKLLINLELIFLSRIPNKLIICIISLFYMLNIFEINLK